MRGGIIITMILVGGMLVVAPLVAEYLANSTHEANLVRLLDKPGTNTVNLHLNKIPDAAEAVCCVVGIVVLATGLYLGVRELRPAFSRPDAPASS